MKKTLGIFGLLVFICAFTAIRNPDFLKAQNIENTIRWVGLYGVISIGVAHVIITGGIDLSIGSVVGLVGSVLALLLSKKGCSPAAGLFVVFCISLAIGLAHGLLITKMRLQPFVVTLCGLLLYRGLARYITADATLGFGSGFQGLRKLATGFLTFGDVRVPMPFLIMTGLALLAGGVLNWTVFGRRLLALGRNETAARYSGINTDRVVITAYVISALLAGFGGVLFSLELNSVQPAGLGESYELYAIAGAVLGGCSLRGGEGGILGVVIGAAVMRALYNAINILGIPTSLEYAIIGAVILGGVLVDELIKRYVAGRRTGAKAVPSPQPGLMGK